MSFCCPIHGYYTPVAGVTLALCPSCTTPPPTATAELGKLRWPYPVDHCASTDCMRPLTEDDGAFLFRCLDNDKLSVFCEDCAANLELNHRQRFLLVAL